MKKKLCKNKNVTPLTKILKNIMKELHSSHISLNLIQTALSLPKKFSLSFLKPSTGHSQIIT